jgi:quinol monooxygenase YgiN
MKEYVMIPFQVQEDKVEEAKKVISEFISHIRRNEPGTLLYNSLQLKKDPTSFIHFMIFADNDAHMKHRSAEYVLEFVKKLYAICPNEPFPIFLENFDSCGVAVDALEQK